AKFHTLHETDDHRVLGDVWAPGRQVLTQGLRGYGQHHHVRAGQGPRDVGGGAKTRVEGDAREVVRVLVLVVDRVHHRGAAPPQDHLGSGSVGVLPAGQVGRVGDDVRE